MKSLYSLVGMKHCGTVDLVASLPSGEPLTLQREPDNQYDPRAIQVHARGVHLGYIASRENADLARAMDATAGGIPLSFDAKLVPGHYPQVEVDITEAKP